MIKIKCNSMKLVPIEELEPHPKNPNSHSDEQISRLAEIIKYQGVRQPIKVSKRSGLITSGHGRLAAFRKLGMKKVPVDFQDYDNDEQEYADLVSDNAIALWSELDISAIEIDTSNLSEDFNLDLLGIEEFKLEAEEDYDSDFMEDHEPAFRLEITFPDKKSRDKEYEKLLADGLLVKVI